MKIGILGSGLMGAKLGTIWARAGHDVVFSYARDPQRLEALARDAGPSARAGTPREAAQADAVLVAVNWAQLDDVLERAGDLAGKVVVTCALPMGPHGEGLVIAHTWSGAEELAKRLPGAHVVAAFGTVPSECFFGVYAARDTAKRPSMIYYGDDERAKAVAVQLIEDVGFAPTDLGPLRIGRYAEPFTLLMGQLAYEGATGPEVAYRFEWFKSD